MYRSRKNRPGEEGTSADKDKSVPGNTVKNKCRAVKQRSFSQGHVHAEKERRRSMKVIVKSAFKCADKDPRHNVADILTHDGITEDSRPSDAGAEEIDFDVENVSSAARATDIAKKLFKFPFDLVRRKSSGKQFLVKMRSA